MKNREELGNPNADLTFEKEETYGCRFTAENRRCSLVDAAAKIDEDEVLCYGGGGGGARAATRSREEEDNRKGENEKRPGRAYL